MSTSLDELLHSNRLWAARTEARSPGFFTNLLGQQAPQYLWIGCADSRVPANELVDLRHVQDVRNRHQDWLDRLVPARRVDALGELNVIEQARNVCQTTVVQDAWARGQSLVVHGWFYGLHDGLLHDLRMTVAGPADMAQAFDAALASVHARHAAHPADDPAAVRP